MFFETFFPSTSFASLIQRLLTIDFLDNQVPGEYSIGKLDISTRRFESGEEL